MVSVDYAGATNKSVKARAIFQMTKDRYSDWWNDVAVENLQSEMESYVFEYMSVVGDIYRVVFRNSGPEFQAVKKMVESGLLVQE